MKKLLGLSAALMLFASCAVGCGDEDDDEKSSKKKNKSSSSSSSFFDNDEDDERSDIDDDDFNSDDDDDDFDFDDDDDDFFSGSSNKKKSDSSDSSSKKKSKKGSSLSESDIIGKWEAEKLITDDGTEMTNIFGIPLAVSFQFEFKKNGTCIVSEQMMDLSPDEDAPEGTWEIDGDTLVLTVEDAETHEDSELEFRLEDEKLVARNIEEGMEGAIYLVQVDEFTKFDLGSLAESFDFDSLLGEDSGLSSDDFDFGDFDFNDFDWDE